MNVVKQIPAYLLGIIFVVFGLNFWLKFIDAPAPTGDVATYFDVMFKTGYLAHVKILEVAIGLLLFIPKTRALALVLIAPIVVNIVLFEICIAKAPSIGIALLAINAVGIFFKKEKYMGIIK